MIKYILVQIYNLIQKMYWKYFTTNKNYKSCHMGMSYATNIAPYQESTSNLTLELQRWELKFSIKLTSIFL